MMTNLGTNLPISCKLRPFNMHGFMLVIVMFSCFENVLWQAELIVLHQLCNLVFDLA